MSDFSIKNNYLLKLANGHTWNFIPFIDTDIFVNNLSQIMGLERSEINSSPRFYFVKNQMIDRLIMNNILGTDNLSTCTWEKIQSAHSDLRFNDKLNNVIINISENNLYGKEMFIFYWSIFPIYYRELFSGGIPFHSAFLQHNGNGFLLPAQGNVGKSTCCERIPGSWKALSDDEALVVYTGEGNYQVHPFPTWSNFIFDRPVKRWEVQYHVPLKAIFFLEQAKNDMAIRLKQGEAASRIYHSSMQIFNRVLHQLNLDKQVEIKKKVFENACVLSNKIPSYRLKFSLSGNFWEEIDRVMSE